MGLILKPNVPILRRGHWSTKGLVAHWPFHEKGGGNARDIAGGNTGTINGAAWVASEQGTALRHDGGSDKVDFGAILDGLGPMTVVLGITNQSQADGNQNLIGKGTLSQSGFWHVRLRIGAARPAFQKSGSTDLLVQTDSNLVVTGQPCQIIVTWDGGASSSGVEFFFNGSKQGKTVSSEGVGLNSDAGLSLATGQDSTYNDFASVSIYNRALSANEISGLYANPYVIYERPRLSWLGAAGETIVDVSGVADFSFTAAGVVEGVGEMAGTADFAFTSQGNIEAYGEMSGTADFNFTASGNIEAYGEMAGVADFSFTATGNIEAFADISGTADVVFTADGIVEGLADISGVANIAFTATGSAEALAEMSGTANITFTADGAMEAYGELSGTASFSFTFSALTTIDVVEVPGVNPVQGNNKLFTSEKGVQRSNLFIDVKGSQKVLFSEEQGKQKPFFN